MVMSLKKSIEILRMLSEDKQLSCDVRNAILQGETALKKQVAKYPEYEGDGYDDSGNLIYDTAYCPYCRHEFEVEYDTPNFCPECGQALDWRDTE